MLRCHGYTALVITAGHRKFFSWFMNFEPRNMIQTQGGALWQFGRINWCVFPIKRKHKIFLPVLKFATTQLIEKIAVFIFVLACRRKQIIQWSFVVPRKIWRISHFPENFPVERRFYSIPQRENLPCSYNRKATKRGKIYLIKEAISYKIQFQWDRRTQMRKQNPNREKRR